MIDLLHISNVLRAGGSVTFSKIDGLYVRAILPSFDQFTGENNQTAVDMNIQNIVDAKIQLQRELQSCDIILNACKDLAIQQPNSSIGEVVSVRDGQVVVQTP